MGVWASWALIDEFRREFPGNTVAVDDDFRKVIVVGSGVRVTFDSEGVLITRNGMQLSSLHAGVTALQVVNAARLALNVGRRT